MKNKKHASLLLIGIFLLSVLSGIFVYQPLWSQISSFRPWNLGLDLAGGWKKAQDDYIHLEFETAKSALRTRLGQLGTAEKLEIPYAIIFGQKEALENFVTLKDMETGAQKEIKLDKVVKEMQAKIKK